MFEGERLAPVWKKLMSKHPDRFIFGIDNVWPEHWSQRYIKQITAWRKALAELPREAAHMIGHGNAERLWNLENR